MDGIPVISADSHIFEPIDLWESRIDKAFRERAPRVVVNHEGKQGTFWVAENINPRPIGTIAALNKKPEELAAFVGAGYEDLRKGGWDPAERIKDQEIDGVKGEVIYATYGMYLFGVHDAALQEACFRAYNDWIIEYCSHAPDRLKGLALISLQNPANAAKELIRCKKMGMAGAMVSSVQRDGKELSDPEFDVFWAAAGDTELPVSIHILTTSGVWGGRFSVKTFGAGFYMAAPHEIQLTLADIILRGVLERHPKVRMVVAEADTGWIPHFLERMERAFTRWEHQNHLKLSRRPSEIFHQQVYATFIQDRIGVLSREWIGVNNLMWSSDYPHTDSTWPNSQASIAHDLAGVPAAEARQLLNGNAARLYGLKAG